MYNQLKFYTGLYEKYENCLNDSVFGDQLTVRNVKISKIMFESGWYLWSSTTVNIQKFTHI